jgi:hypothetical protein
VDVDEDVAELLKDTGGDEDKIRAKVGARGGGWQAACRDEGALGSDMWTGSTLCYTNMAIHAFIHGPNNLLERSDPIFNIIMEAVSLPYVL